MKTNYMIWKKSLIASSLVVIFAGFILVLVGMISVPAVVWFALTLIGILATLEFITRRHYRKTQLLLRRLEELVKVAESSEPEPHGASKQDEEKLIKYDPKGRTAVLLVSGFNGLGLHTLFSVIRLFGSSFRNFVFLQIGVLDARAMKDRGEVSRKTNEVNVELDRYVKYMRHHGYYAVGYPSCGTKIVDEIVRITPNVLEQYPNAVFFGGQLVFPNATLLSGLFHNYTIFAVQKRFYCQGIPVIILPIRVC